MVGEPTGAAMAPARPNCVTTVELAQLSNTFLSELATMLQKTFAA